MKIRINTKRALTRFCPVPVQSGRKCMYFLLRLTFLVLLGQEVGDGGQLRCWLHPAVIWPWSAIREVGMPSQGRLGLCTCWIAGEDGSAGLAM